MRLTLRTLLAYTDDILDPADHEELSKKIEASDFATELIHRSRDTVRRLRLGAPGVLAGGGDGVLDSVSVSDANSVAEYLDNTLAAEDIADFERMCLEPGNEADMHLAEVASCHHVLTMVLGEPAEINADMRQRMYDLPTKLATGQKLRAEPAHESPQPEVAAPVAPPKVQPSARVEPEVPDYLREAARSKGRGLRTVLAATLLLIAGGVGWVVFSPVEQPDAPAGMAAVDLEDAVGDLEIGEADAIVGGADAEGGGEAPAFDASESPTSETAGTEAPVFNPGTTEEEPQAPLADSADVIEEDSVAEVPAETIPVETIEESATEVELPDADAADSVASVEAPTGDLEFPPTEEPAATEEKMTEADATGSEEDPVLIASVGGKPGDASETPTEPIAEPTGPVQVGSYLGNNDMLLRYDAEANRWLRLSPRSAISTGEHLLALPTFRTHVVLADVNTYMSGGTRLFLPGREDGDADGEVDLSLGVTYGEVLLSADLDGSRVAFFVGEDQRRFRLAGSASLAVAVRRVFVPGSDNERQMSPVEVTWYLTSGSVDWLGESGDMQTIEAPATWKTIGGIDGAPEAMAELPRWIDREPMTDMQRRAHTELDGELEYGSPVRLRLMELSDQEAKGRKREVRTLAAEASVHIGEFEPFVKSLSDKDQNRAWDSHIDTLRQALALSPDAAAGVRAAFVSVRGEESGGDLMEMVAGYSLDQIGRTHEEIQDGAVVRLIRWLESDSLDYRVLAIHNLDEIVGIQSSTSWKGFRPEGSSRQRNIVIAKIWESFESKDFLSRP